MPGPGCSKLRKDACGQSEHCNWVPGRKPGCVLAQVTKTTKTKTDAKADQIPIHVLAHIIGFMDDAKNVERARTISKDIHAAVKPAYIDKALLPFVRGFADLVDNNEDVHLESEYARISVDTTMTKAKLFRPTVKDSKGAACNVTSGTIEYVFATKQLHLSIVTSKRHTFQIVVDIASGKDILALWSSSRKLELPIANPQRTTTGLSVTMQSRDLLTMLLFPLDMRKSAKTHPTFSKSIVIRIYNPWGFNDSAVFVPASFYKSYHGLYKNSSLTQGAHKIITIDNLVRLDNNADRSVYFASRYEHGHGIPYITEGL